MFLNFETLISDKKKLIVEISITVFIRFYTLVETPKKKPTKTINIQTN